MDDYAARSRPVSSLTTPPGLTDTTTVQTLTTTVTTSRDFPSSSSQPTFLPLPYPAVQVAAPGKWKFDPDLMVYSAGDSIAGKPYSVASALVDPTQAQLTAVPGLAQAAALAPDLRLPSPTRRRR